MDKKMKPLTNETYVFCVQPTAIFRQYKHNETTKGMFIEGINLRLN